MWYEICLAKQEHLELINEPKSKSATYEATTGIPMSKTMSPGQLLPDTMKQPKKFITSLNSILNNVSYPEKRMFQSSRPNSSFRF